MLPAAGAVRRPEPELVERESDIRRLADGLSCAADGEGSLIFVEGTAGIGKTSLLLACRAAAQPAGVRVLSARAGELERGYAHGVTRQLFERLLVDAGPEVRARWLSGPAALAAPVVLGDPAGALRQSPGDADFAVIHGLYWLAANIAADGPLLLLVDDAHWADPASVRFLSYLANRLEGLPLLVVIAARPADPLREVGVPEALAGLATPLIPAALSAAGTAEVITRQLGASPAEDFIVACHVASGGNPFLLHELLRTLAGDGIGSDAESAAQVATIGPQSVSRAVFLRLSRLPAGSVDFARAVAILGDRVEVRDAADLAGVTLADGATLADALAGAGVLGAERPLCFAHPVIMEAILTDLGPGERARMHARAAELLHAHGGDSEQVAIHLQSSEPAGQPWVVALLREVAGRATARGAADVAAGYLRRALQESVGREARGVLLAELGEAEWLGSDDPRRAAEHLREALPLLAEPAARVRCTILLARATFATGDAVAAARSLELALESEDGFSREDRIRMEAELGSLGVINPTLMPGVVERIASFADLRGETSGELLQLCNIAAIRWMSGTAEQAAAVARRALHGGRLLAAETSDSIAYFQAAWVLAQADHVDEARAACDAGLADARQHGSTLGYTSACSVAAMAAWTGGDLRECEAHARAAMELQIPAFCIPPIHNFLALALIERGDLDGAEQALKDGWVGPYLPVLTHWNGGFYTRGLLRAAQDRHEEAIEDFREFGVRHEEQCKGGNAAIPWRVRLAGSLQRLGREDEARELVEAHEARARRWGTASALGIALHARADFAPPEQRAEILGQAVKLLAASPARLDHARAVAALGAALRRDGLRSEAQRCSAEALELAMRCGASQLAEQANSELIVAGARGRRLQFSGADALTASERRVAQMAIDGLSNRQIAQSLFVTAKTVENHLGRVYQKLGIRSRTELARALAAG